MSNKKFKFKAVPLGGSVPAPGSTGNETYTLFAKQLTSTTFTPIVTDGNGKALEMVTSSGGGGTSTPQTLSQVLTTGNNLDDKEIVGRFKLKNSLAAGRDYTYNITENGLNYSHTDLNDSFDYVLNTHGVIYSFNDENGGVTFNSSFTVDRGGVTFGSDGTSHESGVDFKATKDSGLRFSTWKKNDVDSSYFAFDSNKLEIYSSVNGENNTFYVDSTGAYAEEYKEPVGELYYVQKKYVDDKIAAVNTGGGGGSVDLTPYAKKDATGLNTSDAQAWANAVKPHLSLTHQDIQKTIETGQLYNFTDAANYIKHDFKNISFEIGEDSANKSSLRLNKDSFKLGYEIPGIFNGLSAQDFSTTIYAYDLFISGSKYANTSNPNIDKVATVNYQTGRFSTYTYAQVGYKLKGNNNEVFIGTDNSLGESDTRTANVSIGVENLENLTSTSSDNVAMGYKAGKLTTGSRNTFVGSTAGHGQKNGSDNVFVGYNAGGGSENSTGNVFIGANVGTGLRGQVSLADIKLSSPIFEEYTKDANLARDLGYDTTTQKFNSTTNVLIGYQSTALNNTINRAIGSIGIGYQPLTGAGWRLYNSINIGNFIYGGRTSFNYYNVITIGNHIRPGSTYGSLHIDNGIDKRIQSIDTLIYGQFENAIYNTKKQLKINGIFSLNTSYMEKAEDVTNHKLLVRQNVSGQVKYVELTDLPFTKPNPNLLRNSALPLMAANDTGAGTYTIMEEPVGKFVRYTPDAGKRVWLYGFKFPNNGNGKYSRSVLIRHNHASDLVIWGQTVKPNVWTRIKQEAYTGATEWQVLDAVENDVVIDLKQYKLEESLVSTDWIAHVDDTMGSGVEEAPADGKMYVRQNGRWVELTKEVLQNILN
mgnify:CR=1 FL=1